jgi:diguanylate cyclase (GGDEF)-like protein
MQPGSPSGAGAEVLPSRARKKSLRISLGAWLALGFAGIAGVFLGGNVTIQQSTRQATQEVSLVQRHYEPVARLSRELGDSLAAFDRAILQYVESGSNTGRSEIDAAHLRIARTMAEQAELQRAPADIEAVAALHLEVGKHQQRGAELLEKRERARQMLASSWSLLNAASARISKAGAGLSVGENVLARRSLADLVQAMAGVRSRLTEQLASGANAEKALDAAERNFERTLRQYWDEFMRSPGKAWLDLVNDDFQTAMRQRRSALQLENAIKDERIAFSVASSDLRSRVHAQFEEPAWQALAAATRRATETGAEAERKVALVSIAAAAMIVLVALAIVFGVILPVKRLMHGTRRLAAGQLATRVARGGTRELDELAGAFNHMAGELAHAEQAVREYQARLEQRVAKRTRQLRHLAHHDPLTALPNRRRLSAYLTAALRRCMRRGQRLAVLFLDLDNFKTINDSMGHEFGDGVLREIAARLRTIVGPNGFVARLGGDEFTLIIENAGTQAEVERRGALLVAEFQRALDIGKRELVIGASVGAAIYPDHAHDIASLLRAADAALFRAKELGRNRVNVYSPELLVAASHRFQTEQALRQAIDNGDLTLHYQPQVSLASCETNTVEALLRWRLGADKIMVAAEFLGIAEQSGLILEVNRWVMRQAAEEASAWRRDGWPNARIAINVSSQQFLSGDFVVNIERLLEQYSLPPECIELELTEHALQTGAVTIDTLRSLRLLGVAVALDDFGTGFSSLTSLDQLPISRVKLDRSLVADVDTNPRAAAIARSIIGLCRSLGLQVTAEGVERQAQLEFLTTCGDVHVQGYLIGRPSAAEYTLDFVKSTRIHMARLLERTEEARAMAARNSETKPNLRVIPTARR